MKKESLNRFIEKYSLGGNINSVVMECTGGKLNTRFITDDKSLLGELTLDKFGFEDCIIGIGSTDQLTKLLSVLGTDVDLSLTKVENEGDKKAISMAISDSSATVSYMLSDTSVINKPPNLKELPNFDIKVKVDKQFMDTFVKGKNALPDVDSFTVITDDSNVNLVIGYSSINTNRVTIPVQTTEHSNVDKISFSAKLLKDLLVANKECESAELEISSKGLARINFSIDDYTAQYYMVAIDEVD